VISDIRTFFGPSPEETGIPLVENPSLADKEPPMQLLSWLYERMTGRPHTWRAPARKPAPRFRPRLESLERRDVPSTLAVTNTHDSGAGSLRADIAAAQSGDTIDLSNLGGQTIALTSGELVINKSLTIQGPASAQVTVNAGLHSRVFEVDGTSTNVTLSGLTITRGSATSGSGSNNFGAGVYNNAATLSIVDSTLSGNFATYGGGVYNYFGTLSIVNSTLSGNNARSSGGGVYNNLGTVFIAGSTLSGNYASYGGGVYNRGNPLDSTTGQVTISTSTLSGNTASSYGGGLYNSSGSMTVSNSTLTSNSASDGSGVYTVFSLPSYTPHRVTITDCTFSKNHGSGSGSDIWNASNVALVTVSGSTFSGHSILAIIGLWVNGGGDTFGF
jgi:hypothetical protein